MRISDWSSDVCSSDLTIGPGLGRTVLGERDTGTLRPCELLVVLQESQGHVRHRLMRPIILRNAPQQSRIAVRDEDIATEDVPGWTSLGVSAAKMSGVPLVVEKVEHSGRISQLVDNRHTILRSATHHAWK